MLLSLVLLVLVVAVDQITKHLTVIYLPHPGDSVELIPGFLDGISGTYKDPVGYFVCEKNPEAFEQFEATFPKKKS